MAKQTNNWIKKEGNDGIEWTHKHDPRMRVVIMKSARPLRMAEYIIFHVHPAPDKVIMQYPEGAKTMKAALAKAMMHLLHWNDPKKWKSDPDYGKLTDKP